MVSDAGAGVHRAVMVEEMSIRKATRMFSLHRDTVRKILAYTASPGYRPQTPPGVPTLRQGQDGPFTGVIDRNLEVGHQVPKKQRDTAKRIFERLRTSTGSTAATTSSRTMCGSTAV